MSKEKSIINCPKCGEEIDVNDILYHQVDEQLKKEYKDELAKLKEKYEGQTSKLEEEWQKLKTEKAKQEEEIAKKVIPHCSKSIGIFPTAWEASQRKGILYF